MLIFLCDQIRPYQIIYLDSAISTKVIEWLPLEEEQALDDFIFFFFCDSSSDSDLTDLSAIPTIYNLNQQ